MFGLYGFFSGGSDADWIVVDFSAESNVEGDDAEATDGVLSCYLKGKQNSASFSSDRTTGLIIH